MAKNKEKGLGDMASPALTGKNGKTDEGGQKENKLQIAKGEELPNIKVKTETFQMINYLKKDILKNHSIMEHFVNEFREAGLIPLMVAELIGCNETYMSLAEVCVHPTYGPRFKDRLNSAINESVSPPYGEKEEEKKNDEDNDEDGDEDDFDDEDA